MCKVQGSKWGISSGASLSTVSGVPQLLSHPTVLSRPLFPCLTTLIHYYFFSHRVSSEYSLLPHKCWIERKNLLPWPAGYTLANAVHCRVGLLNKETQLTCSQLVHWDTHNVLLTAELDLSEKPETCSIWATLLCEVNMEMLSRR